MLLDNGRFLTELLRLYQATRTQGTVWVSCKRSETVEPAQLRVRCGHRAMPSFLPAANLKPRKGKRDYSQLAYHCLVRVTDGSKKLSTVVEVRR